MDNWYKSRRGPAPLTVGRVLRLSIPAALPRPTLPLLSQPAVETGCSRQSAVRPQDVETISGAVCVHDVTEEIQVALRVGRAEAPVSTKGPAVEKAPDLHPFLPRSTFSNIEGGASVGGHTVRIRQ